MLKVKVEISRLVLSFRQEVGSVCFQLIYFHPQDLCQVHIETADLFCKYILFFLVSFGLEIFIDYELYTVRKSRKFAYQMVFMKRLFKKEISIFLPFSSISRIVRNGNKNASLFRGTTGVRRNRVLSSRSRPSLTRQKLVPISSRRGKDRDRDNLVVLYSRE